ncbi:hypothetical protein JW887_00755 [Candidatus Dojkabacteria bacterium]|nr:hypothetical protein [Candidatus Dojkabacteria bacterium]
MAVIKNLIAPFQKVLINKRLCPGCTMPLDKAKKFPYNPESEMTICQCRRMYIYDRSSDSYRRATLKEAEMFSKK